MQSDTGTIGLSRNRFVSSFLTRRVDHSPTAVPPSLARWVQLPQPSRLLQRTHPEPAAVCRPTRKPSDARWRLPWGFGLCPPHDVSRWCPLSARASHCPHYGPPSTFLTSSTGCSTTGLVGLFRPTAVYRVLPSRGFPSNRAVSGFPDRCPHAVVLADLRCDPDQSNAPSTSRPCSLLESGNATRRLDPTTSRAPHGFSPPPGVHPTRRRNALTSLPPMTSTAVNPPRPAFGVLPARRLACLESGCRPARGLWPEPHRSEDQPGSRSARRTI